MKKTYCILTDATSDLTPQEIKEHDIKVIPMPFTIADQTYWHTPEWSNMSYHEFYQRVAAEKVFTSQITQTQFEQSFQEYLTSYDDILLLCFSSGISGTFKSSQQAKAAIQQKFPSRKIYTVDSLTTSIGLGYLAIKAAKLRAAGHSIDQTHAEILSAVRHTSIWFTVRDIKGLARSGRCSPLTAFVGSKLSLTPVLHVDDKGLLEPVKKVRGYQKALDEIIGKIAKLSIADPNQQTLHICEGYFNEAVTYLSDHIKNLWPNATIKTVQISPIVGCHTGPGVIGVSFSSTTR
jgi:DegV family protein with EDD domain